MKTFVAEGEEQVGMKCACDSDNVRRLIAEKMGEEPPPGTEMNSQLCGSGLAPKISQHKEHAENNHL